VKDWLSNGHPYPAYLNSPLFCGLGRKNIGRSISRHTIHAVYAKYKKVHFPKLLKDPLVPEDDKRKICDLLQKPWNPYLRRHTAATELFKAVKDPKIVNQYFGWSENSNMYRRYSHYFADDSIDAILTVIDGLKPPPRRSSLASSSGSNKDLLRPKQCPNCSESNKPEAKFCAKCKFVLSFDAFNEAVKSADEKEKELQELKLQQENNSKDLQRVIGLLGELISKSNALDFKDIKWPLLQVVDYYEDNRGPGAGVSEAKDILNRWREERRGNNTKNTI
jgi:hypothetical protein